LSIMRALDLGEAVVLSPLQYTLIVWSTFWGFSIFAHLPDTWTLIGTAIIVASGIYSLYHETRPARKAADMSMLPGKLPGNGS
ncbi:EamA/RhaT family transporter, partial [Rhizobiaceae sp. 2RAB30]